MKESDLSNTTTQFLKDQGCNDVYGEIIDIDLVGIKDKIIYAVELKTSLNIKVLEQAKRRLENAHYVYVAVPIDKLPSHYDLISEVYTLFMNYYGLGLIGVNPEYTSINRTLYFYEVFKQPKINRTPKYKKALLDNLIDLKRELVGGLQSHEVLSPYKWMMDEVKEYLKRKLESSDMNLKVDKNQGWVSIDQLLVNCKRVRKHYANPKSSLIKTLKSSHNNHWVESNKNSFRYKGEHYEL